MGLTDGAGREGIPEEIEDELTKIEEQAYSLRKLLGLYGYEVSEAPVYDALEQIRDAIEGENEKASTKGRPAPSRFETGYGSAAKITETELIIIPDSGKIRHYPLIGIHTIHERGLPGGESTVHVTMKASGDGPGLTFKDPDTATEFTNALLHATNTYLGTTAAPTSEGRWAIFANDEEGYASQVSSWMQREEAEAAITSLRENGESQVFVAQQEQ